jgi:hypothetical protein
VALVFSTSYLVSAHHNPITKRDKGCNWMARQEEAGILNYLSWAFSDGPVCRGQANAPSGVVVGQHLHKGSQDAAIRSIHAFNAINFSSRMNVPMRGNVKIWDTIHMYYTLSAQSLTKMKEEYNHYWILRQQKAQKHSGVSGCDRCAARREDAGIDPTQL